MDLTVSKLLALALALFALVLGVMIMPRDDLGIALAAAAIIGGAFVLFSDEIGGLTGFVAHGHIVDTPTPGCMLIAIGWTILIVATAVGVLKLVT